MRTDKFLLAVQKMNAYETNIIYDLLFQIFKFEEISKVCVDKATQTESISNEDIKELQNELHIVQAKNELYERMIAEIKSENSMIIEFLKNRLMLLEEENKNLRNGKNIEDYIMELSNRIEEERTRTNSVLSFNNKLENTDEQSRSYFCKQETQEDLKQLKEEIAKLTRQNTMLIEKCGERSLSSDSEDLNYID
jgi:hypothetical protein